QVGRLDRAAEARKRCQPIDQCACTAPVTIERSWRTSFGGAPAALATVTRPSNSQARSRLRCSRIRSWALDKPWMVSRQTTTTYGDSTSRSVPHGHWCFASSAKLQYWARVDTPDPPCAPSSHTAGPGAGTGYGSIRASKQMG